MPKDNAERREAGAGTSGLCSVVVCMYNEVKGVEDLHRRIVTVMTDTGRPFEIVFVDDGSTDGTHEVLARAADGDEHVSVVVLRRNFGQTAALQAGFDHAAGEVVVAMDGDLENVPEDIPKLLAKLEEGYDIVSGWRKDRAHGLLLRRIPSQAASWLISRATGVKLHDFGCTLKAYRRDMLDHVRLYGDQHRFIPAVADLAGARVAEVVVQHVARPHGRSKYGIGRVPRVLADLTTLHFLRKYGTKPMHFFGGVALTLLAVVLLMGIVGVVSHLVWGASALGWAALLALMLLVAVAGVLSLLMGFLAEMLVRTRHESTGRRIYTVREVHRGGKPAR